MNLVEKITEGTVSPAHAAEIKLVDEVFDIFQTAQQSRNFCPGDFLTEKVFVEVAFTLFRRRGAAPADGFLEGRCIQQHPALNVWVRRGNDYFSSHLPKCFLDFALFDWRSFAIGVNSDDDGIVWLFTVALQIPQVFFQLV
ncbi:hypothetical protein L6R21_06760 [bacterium]|nr:hypothetical protein [bacterium]